MVVSLAAIVGTAAILLTAVIHGTVPHEAMLKRLLPLTMPLVVAYHLFLLYKDPEVTVHTVEMFSISQLLTIFDFTLRTTAKSTIYIYQLVIS